MAENKRKIFSGTEKAKVAVAVVKGDKTINEVLVWLNDTVES